MNPGEGFHDHCLDAQIQRRKRGVLTGASLPIVCTANNYALAFFLAAGRKFGIAAHKAMLRNGRDIRTQRQDLCPRWHDVIGGDVVTDLQQHLSLDAVRQLCGLGERLNVRAAFHRDGVHLLFRRGSDNHVIVDQESLRQPDIRHLAKGARIGKHAGQCGDGGSLRADEVHLAVGSAGSGPQNCG